MVKAVEDQIFVNQCIAVASIVILYYDYLLTLPREIDRFWASRRITWASSLFYLNRYLSLLGHGPVIFQYFWRSSDPDRLDVIVGLLLIMRTYALYNCNKAILILICSAGLTVICFGIYCVVSGHSKVYTVDDLPSIGCLLPVGEDVSKRLAEAWTGMLAFDILIFTMILYKSITYRRQGSHILQVMLRDGTIYFGSMLAATSSVLLSFHLSPSYEQGMTVTLTNIVSSTMISRLMLNLRDPKINSSYRQEGTLAATGTGAIFTSIIHTSIDGDFMTTQQDTPTILPANSHIEVGNVINSSIELHVRTTPPV